MCPSTDPFALEGLQEEHVVSGSWVLRTDAVETTAVKEIAEERPGIRRRTGDLMLEVAEESLVEGGCVGFGSASHGGHSIVLAIWMRFPGRIQESGQ